MPRSPHRPQDLIVVVRHAESAANASDLMCGQLDVDLSAAGREAAAALRGPLDASPYQVTTASALRRARHSALLLGADDQVLFSDAGLDERDAGPFTGMSRRDLRRAYPGFVDGFRPEGFEALDAVVARMRAALRRACDGLPGGSILVSHGASMRALEVSLGGPGTKIANLGSLLFGRDGRLLGRATLPELLSSYAAGSDRVAAA